MTITEALENLEAFIDYARGVESDEIDTARVALDRVWEEILPGAGSRRLAARELATQQWEKERCAAAVAAAERRRAEAIVAPTACLWNNYPDDVVEYNDVGETKRVRSATDEERKLFPPDHRWIYPLV